MMMFVLQNAVDFLEDRKRGKDFDESVFKIAQPSPRCHYGYDVQTLGRERVYCFERNVLIGEELHLASYFAGYTFSMRRMSTAYASTADSSSLVNCG